MRPARSCLRCHLRLRQASQPPRTHLSRREIRRRVVPDEKSTRTAIIGQSGGVTSLLAGPTPGTNKVGSNLGSHTQSTTASAKWIASGTKSVHQVADSHSGTSSVAVAASLSSFRHTLPISLNGQLIQADPAPIERERVDACRSPAPVKRVELLALAVDSGREKVHTVWPETLLQFAEELVAQHRVVRDEQL